MSLAGDLWVRDGHAYDRETILWCAERQAWGRLRGSLQSDRAEQLRAITWAKEKGDE